LRLKLQLDELSDAKETERGMAFVATHITCLQAYGESFGVKFEPMAALFVQPAILPPNFSRRGHVPLFLWDAFRLGRHCGNQPSAHHLLLFSLTENLSTFSTTIVRLYLCDNQRNSHIIEFYRHHYLPFFRSALEH
jgi:hypothetical protein